LRSTTGKELIGTDSTEGPVIVVVIATVDSELQLLTMSKHTNAAVSAARARRIPTSEFSSGASPPCKTWAPRWSHEDHVSLTFGPGWYSSSRRRIFAVVP
jgi:hypothetical protein